MNDIMDETAIGLNAIELQVVAKLVLKFARSVDVPEKEFNPDGIAYPIMFEITKGLLTKLGADYPSHEQGRSRLIAAAPELLAALEVVTGDLEKVLAARGFRDDPKVAQARAALSKATGAA